MIRKDKVEMERARALKAYRTAIRLKYSLLADEEINEKLPAVEEAFNKAVAGGQPFQLQVGSVFAG